MTIFQALILGIVQGLTEFLPVSSSAHLVIVPSILGWQFPTEQIMPFNVLVQLGTLAAVIVYFYKDLWRIILAFVKALLERKPFSSFQARLGWYIILGTIPAGLFGLLIKNLVEDTFKSVLATGLFLVATAAILTIGEKFGRKNRLLDEMNWKDALFIGLLQAASIFPGVSRSGATISAGMMHDFKREDAARFSFLLSIPIMLAAGLLETIELFHLPDIGSFLQTIIVGIFAAAVVGFLSIHWLLRFLTRRPLKWFAIYCLCLGITVVFLVISGIMP